MPEGTREIISTSLYPDSPEGSTPDGVAVSPDGRTLFVANADNNCVMVVDISNSTTEGARQAAGTTAITHFAGASPAAVELIRRHQSKLKQGPYTDRLERLLYRLQSVDNER